MKILKKHIAEFNQPDSLMVVSSFPQKKAEIASKDALARYTYLLVKNFPKNQKLVIFSEKSGESSSYLIGDNILVVPSFSKNSPLFFLELIKNIATFSLAKNLLFQFEFSVYGGKRTFSGIILLLTWLKANAVNVTTALHQVILDLKPLHGHLGVKKNSTWTKILNRLLSAFYRAVGFLSNKVVVHDRLLAKRLLGLVNEGKLEVISHGIDKTKKFSKSFEVKSRKHFGFKRDEKVVTLFGYHSWYKGTDWIVKTAGQIAKENPNRKIKLFLAGDKSPTLKDTKAYKAYSKKLEKFISENEKSVVVSGFVPEKDVKKVYAASDVVVFPYRTKMSASGPLALAWQYQKPFLLSSNLRPGVAEDLGDKMNKDGVFFNMNKKDFGTKLFSVLSKAALKRQLAKVGKEIAEERSWKAVALQYRNVSLKPKAVKIASYGAYATK